MWLKYSVIYLFIRYVLIVYELYFGFWVGYWSYNFEYDIYEICILELRMVIIIMKELESCGDKGGVGVGNGGRWVGGSGDRCIEN